MKPDEITVPPADEQSEFFAWVMSIANAESDGMPECVLAGPEGETIQRSDQP